MRREQLQLTWLPSLGKGIEESVKSQGSETSLRLLGQQLVSIDFKVDNLAPLLMRLEDEGRAIEPTIGFDQCPLAAVDGDGVTDTKVLVGSIG